MAGNNGEASSGWGEEGEMEFGHAGDIVPDVVSATYQERDGRMSSTNEEFVLFVDPSNEISGTLQSFLKTHGFIPLKASGHVEAAKICKDFTPRIALMNTSLDSDFSEHRILSLMRAARGKNVGSVLLSDVEFPECGDIEMPRYVRDKGDNGEILCALRETTHKIDLMDERDEFLARVVEYSERLEEMVAEKTARLQAVNDRLQKLSVTDDLTGVYNRRYFFERLGGDINMVNRYGQPVSVVLLDLDDFKRVNDCKGHLVGDAVLRDFAALLRRTVRKGETVARYGGEEFAIILPHTGATGARKAADKIRRTLEKSPLGGAESIKLTASIGVAQVREGEGVDEVLSRADLAMYEAKAGGKNRVVVAPMEARVDCE